MKKHKSAFSLNKYAFQASYCYVADSIWIGDFGTAIRVADGSIVNTFTAVFNAAGTEAYGISLESSYAKLGVHYDTLFDKETGLTLGDGPIFEPEDEVGRGMASNFDIEPSVPIKVGDSDYKVHAQHYVTDDIFYYLMYVASVKIENLVKQSGSNANVLVHCAAGRNRSAASIASYLVLRKQKDPYETVKFIQNIVLERRGIPALTNDQFIKGIRFLQSTLQSAQSKGALQAAIDGLRKRHLQSYKLIVDAAKRYAKTLPSENYVGCRVIQGQPILVDDESECEKRLALVMDTLTSISLMGVSCRNCGSTCHLLQRCSACKKAFYCSQWCQIEHASHHKYVDKCPGLLKNSNIV